MERLWWKSFAGDGAGPWAACASARGLASAMGEGGSGECSVGRRRGRVLGVLCSLLRVRLGLGYALCLALVDGSGLARSRGRMAGGGKPGVDEGIEEAVMVGCAEDKKREETYECLRSRCSGLCWLISDFKRSSWWTAILKRFQKLGSRVAMVARAGSLCTVMKMEEER